MNIEQWKWGEGKTKKVFEEKRIEFLKKLKIKKQSKS